MCEGGVEFLGFDIITSMTGKQKLKLKVKKRDLVGKKVKKVRRQGFIPATVYGKGFKSVAIQFSKDQLKVLREAGETHVVYMELEKKQLPVMVRQVQYHPVTDQVLHVDFYKVDLKEKTTAYVPIELVGEAPITKQGYNVVQVLHEVEVLALPTEIPESIQVNISVLKEEGQDIRIKDVKLAEGVEFVSGVDPEETIVIVEKPQEEPEEEVVETETEVQEPKEEKKEEAQEKKETEEKTGQEG